MGKIAELGIQYCGGSSGAAISVNGQIISTDNPPINYVEIGGFIVVSDATGQIAKLTPKGEKTLVSSVSAAENTPYCGTAIAELVWNKGKKETNNAPIQYDLQMRQLTIDGVNYQFNKELNNTTPYTQDTVSGGVRVDWGGGDVEILSGTSWTTAVQENQTVSYSITLSNWNMGGVEYGAYSGSFSYSKRLKLNDLVYAGSSFFSGKTIISSLGSPSYPNASLGYLAIEWNDSLNNLYYSLIAQTSSTSHFFQINTLTIRDTTNNFTYYQDLYRDGSVLSNSSQSFSYSLSNWNSSGVNYAGYSGSFSTPVAAQVVGLISFRGAWTGGGTVIGNATYAPNYPFSGYGYNAVQLLGTNGVTYVALIGQWVTSFSIDTFNLSSNGWLYYSSSWTNTSSGFINNPPTSGVQPPYEGAKSNPIIPIRVTTNTGAFSQRTTLINPTVMLDLSTYKVIANFIDSTTQEIYSSTTQPTSIYPTKNYLKISDSTGQIADFDYTTEPTNFVANCYDFVASNNIVSVACKGECPSDAEYQCQCENNLYCYGYDDPINPTKFVVKYATAIA